MNILTEKDTIIKLVALYRR